MHRARERAAPSRPALAHHRRACARNCLAILKLPWQHGRAVERGNISKARTRLTLACRSDSAHTRGAAGRRKASICCALSRKISVIDALNVFVFQDAGEQGRSPRAGTVRDELRRTPTLLGLDKLLEAQLSMRRSNARARSRAHQGLVNQHAQSPPYTGATTAVGRAILLALPACARPETSPAPHGRKGH